jgi:uncharacterized protein
VDEAEVQAAWGAHVSAVRRSLPDVHIEAEGETLRLGELSPGCQACKDGTWECVFLTLECNLDCRFCLSSSDHNEFSKPSIFGNSPEEIENTGILNQVQGISFTGGEPFLDPDRLFEWFSWFKSRYPEKYYWIYTKVCSCKRGICNGLQNLA